MERTMVALFAGLSLVLAHDARGADRWIEGTHYALLSPVQHITVPAGKVEVMEVFSYACIVCNTYRPVIERLEQSLPSNARMVFLPASFNTAEDWPVFQRAYFAAQSLGIAERAHQTIFDAVWKTGELAITDPTAHRLRSPQPSIEDVARCYARTTGVKPEAFLAAARSFSVETKMRAADAQIHAMQVPGTPCFVVNGKYRVNRDALRNNDELIELVRYLVAKEAGH